MTSISYPNPKKISLVDSSGAPIGDVANPLFVTGISGGGAGDASAANQLLQLTEAANTNALLSSPIHTILDNPTPVQEVSGSVSIVGDSASPINVVIADGASATNQLAIIDVETNALTTLGSPTDAPWDGLLPNPSHTALLKAIYAKPGGAGGGSSDASAANQTLQLGEAINTNTLLSAPLHALIDNFPVIQPVSGSVVASLVDASSSPIGVSTNPLYTTGDASAANQVTQINASSSILATLGSPVDVAWDGVGASPTQMSVLKAIYSKPGGASGGGGDASAANQLSQLVEAQGANTSLQNILSSLAALLASSGLPADAEWDGIAPSASELAILKKIHSVITSSRSAYTPSPSSGSGSVAADTNYTLSPANADRRTFLFQNQSSGSIYLSLSGPAFTGGVYTGVAVPPYGYFEPFFAPTTAIQIASPLAGAMYYFVEG